MAIINGRYEIVLKAFIEQREVRNYDSNVGQIFPQLHKNKFKLFSIDEESLKELFYLD